MSGLFDQIYAATVKKIALSGLISEEITHRAVATGTETTVQAQVELQSGALDDQGLTEGELRGASAVARLSSDATDGGIATITVGDEFDWHGRTWKIVKVRPLPGDMHELRGFSPELVA